HHLVHERGRTDITFAIVGPGDGTDDLRAEIQRRRLHDVIHLPGVLTDAAKVRTYVATADVCVSVDERNAMNDRSTMMKVLEYMAMGRAVVQFPLEEMARLCGETTVYARNADAIDLAEKIAALLDDPPTRERLGADARRRVLDGMMWSDQSPVLDDAVRAALGAARSGRSRGGAQAVGRARRWSRNPMP
ncbi:MAG TPA: glycosyltransferase, partial [Acidimicrobiales bacterium]|nr:glycosyltransferase [Acidimicrobiales bacterium]